MNQPPEQLRELSPLGDVFSGLYRHTWDLHERGELEESFDLARRLLTYAKLGDFHRAGLHFILGGSSQDYVWHSERALYLYQNLYVVRPGGTFDGSKEPDQQCLEDQKYFIAQSQDMLDKAKKTQARIDAKFERDMKRYRDYYGQNPTAEQLIEADMARTSEATDAYFASVDEILEKQYDMPLVALEPDSENDEDDNKISWPTFGLPTPPDSQPKNLFPGSSQGSASQPRGSQG